MVLTRSSVFGDRLLRRRRWSLRWKSRRAVRDGDAHEEKEEEEEKEEKEKEDFVLVQTNVAIGVDAAESEAMRGFFDGLAMVNQCAKEADGFIAMLGEDGGGGAGELPDDWYLNISVWRDVASLMNFVYTGEHRAYLKRKHEW